MHDFFIIIMQSSICYKQLLQFLWSRTMFNMYFELLDKICLFVYTRRYGPLRGLTSSSCGGLRPLAEAFFALWAKKELIMLFWPIFGVQ